MSARILFVITTLDVGGAEKHLLWLTRGVRARGHDVDVVYLKGAGRLSLDFEAAGAAVTRIPFERSAQALSTVFALARHIKRGGYDVVHTHLLKADALGALACAIAKPTVHVQSKHNEEQVLKRRPVALVHGVLSRRADRIVALSDHVHRYVVDVGRAPAERVVRIYYGIDPSPFEGGDRDGTRSALGLGKETHVGLCVARFHPQKDHATLFRAVRRLKDDGRDVRLLLAGGDPFYDHQARAEADVATMGLEGVVTFLGIRDDVPDLLAACDVFVLPSLYEGLGLVYLEAMAASRPVLATRSSAIPEVVIEGETGHLVDVGDDASLAAGWGRLADEPGGGAALGAAGRARVEAVFGLDRMIDETVAVYRSAGAPV